jgi:hypothetical protein
LSIAVVQRGLLAFIFIIMLRHRGGNFTLIRRGRRRRHRRPRFRHIRSVNRTCMPCLPVEPVASIPCPTVSRRIDGFGIDGLVAGQSEDGVLRFLDV